MLCCQISSRYCANLLSLSLSYPFFSLLPILLHYKLRSASVYIDAAASHSNNLPTYILTTNYYIQVVYDAAADHKHTQNLVLE